MIDSRTDGQIEPSMDTTLNTQANSLEAVQGAIDDTFNGIGFRLYGGHILLVAGEVNMFNCHIWDYFILIQLTDVVVVGGDVLVSVRSRNWAELSSGGSHRLTDPSLSFARVWLQVVGGVINMVGCSYTASVLFTKCVVCPLPLPLLLSLILIAPPTRPT